MTRYLTAIIEKEGSGYVALCSELDIVSQGDTIEDARKNLREAVELFLESASSDEVSQRLKSILDVCLNFQFFPEKMYVVF